MERTLSNGDLPAGLIPITQNRAGFPGHTEEALRLRSARRHTWIVLAAFLALFGVMGSIYCARAVARTSSERSHRSFIDSSAQVASTLRLALQHEEDLIISTQGFVLGNPGATETQFVTWVTDTRVLQRYPELLGFGSAQIVPASDLTAFASRTTTNFPEPFQVRPPGMRAFYCFPAINVERGAGLGLPSGYDLCAGAAGQRLLATRDSGKDDLTPITVHHVTSFSLSIPIYRSGSPPQTNGARTSAFVGWVGMTLVLKVLLDTALQGHPDMAAALLSGSTSSKVDFRSGNSKPGWQRTTINLRDGWIVRTSGLVDQPGLFGNGEASVVLLGGVSLSILLGALVLVLGTGRARLRFLVDERTDELRFQALHDSLTGLPNRTLIMDRIDQLLARNRRNGTAGAALYIDLDDFKNVNDSLGHEAGDRLLVAVAARMASTLRGADTIGRMGGDEFVVLMDGSEPLVAPELVAQRLLDVMKQPFAIDDLTPSMLANTSIGIAVGDRATGGELMRDADIALYQAKAMGKNRYEFFHPEMQTDIGRRIALEFDLRSALVSDQFRLVYQPIYNLADLVVVGVEALLRWEHPVEGILPPDEFIPILEQTGQIREVGAWVLKESCRQAALWHAKGDVLDISVNVSGRQLDDDRIVEHIRDALTASNLAPDALIIEVTETTLMRDAKSAMQRLRDIKDLGVSIAVDDFGTGYSSLAYLQQFPVDCIKIDKSFISAMHNSAESLALIRTFVQLGSDLGLKTLAEGVETAEELELLRSDHVNEAQGYLFARPLHAGVFEEQFLAPMRHHLIGE